MHEMTLCITPTVFLIAIFGTIIVTRYFKHREIMAMVEKGVLPEQYAQYTSASRGQRSRGTMGWGIALVALGLALMVGLWPLGFARMGGGNPYPLNFGPWMLIGLVPLFIGVALLIIYFVTRKDEVTTSEKPEQLEEPFVDD
jgi:hypothetical protein